MTAMTGERLRGLSLANNGMRVCEHLFFVSTLGQFRNAQTLIETLALENCDICVLSAKHSTKMARQIFDAPCAEGIYLHSLEQPRSQNSGLPWVVKTICKRYGLLLDRLEPKTIWLSNLNKQYAVLGELAKTRGCQVGFFEEGLGSYKRFDQQVFELLPLRQRLGDFSTELKRRSQLIQREAAETALGLSGLARRFVLLLKFLRFILYQCIMIPLRGRERLGLLPLVLSPTELKFYSVCCDVDRAIVALPEKLDPVIFRHATCTKLMWQYEPEAAAQLVQKLAHEGVTADIRPVLFVSQIYGIEPDAYYRAISRALLRYSSRPIVLKFHPKEPDSSKRVLMNALNNLEVKFHHTEASPGSSSEIFMETGLFERVISLTSSSLVFGAVYFPDIEFISITDKVIDELKSHGAFLGKGCDELLQDQLLLENTIAP